MSDRLQENPTNAAFREVLEAIANSDDPSRSGYLSEFECRQLAREVLDV